MRIFSIILIMIPCLLWGQSGRQAFRVQVLTGAEAGWWVYNKGLTDTLPIIHRGYDRSHLAFMLPLEVGLIYERNKVEWGLSFNYRTLYDDVLIRSDHARFNYRKIPVTTDDKQVRLLQLGLSGSYIWITGPRYEFHSGLKLGVFHPFQIRTYGSPLGFKWFQEILLTQKVFINRHFHFIFVPKIARMRIRTRNSPYKGERHDIYRIGFQLGLRMGLRGQ